MYSCDLLQQEAQSTCDHCLCLIRQSAQETRCLLGSVPCRSFCNTPVTHDSVLLMHCLHSITSWLKAIYWHCQYNIPSRVYEMVQSVCMSVCPNGPTAGRRYRSITAAVACGRRMQSSANLSAYVDSWTQTCSDKFQVSIQFAKGIISS